MTPRRKTLAPTEADILKVMTDFLEIQTNMGRLRYFRMQPIRLVTRNGKTFPGRIKESQKGAPDLVVFTPRLVFALELKKPGEDLRPSQKEWWEFFLKCEPVQYFKIDSVRQAGMVIRDISSVIR